MEDNTSALHANMINNIMALKINQAIPIFYEIAGLQNEWSQIIFETPKSSNK